MKNAGILKFALFALVATSQLTMTQVAFGMATKAEKNQAQCPVCFEQTNQMLHGDHVACPDCLGDQIDHAHANRNAAKNDAMLNCPRQGCQYQITQADVQRIIPAHLPQFQEIMQARAEQAQPVNLKAQKQDRANRLWQFQHTKPCPQCRRPIEKNGGCKYVDCVGCKTNFCYECLHISRAGSHEPHAPCVASRDPWAPEKAQLAAEQRQRPAAPSISSSEANGLIIGGIILVAAIWGISELYNFFKAPKKPKVDVRTPLVRNAPRRQAKPVRVR